MNFKASGKKKRKVKKKTEEDLYALLGLQHERWTATDAQLKLGEWLAVYLGNLDVSRLFYAIPSCVTHG